jgi:hypothetical protein
MSEAFLDTDVIIWFITGDDPVKQTAAHGPNDIPRPFTVPSLY